MSDVGKKMLALDLRSSASPALRCVLPNSASLREIVAELNRRIMAVIDDLLPGVEWSLGEPIAFVLHPQTRHILPHDVEQEIWDKKLEPIREAFALAHDARLAEIEKNKHNGKLGWWRVDGIRHGYLVWADSTMEAIKKSGVGDWEAATAEWVGENQEVISL